MSDQRERRTHVVGEIRNALDEIPSDYRRMTAAAKQMGLSVRNVIRLIRSDDLQMINTSTYDKIMWWAELENPEVGVYKTDWEFTAEYAKTPDGAAFVQECRCRSVAA